jgi:hypothetical protein
MLITMVADSRLQVPHGSSISPSTNHNAWLGGYYHRQQQRESGVFFLHVVCILHNVLDVVFKFAEAERLFNDGLLNASSGPRKKRLLVQVLTVHIETVLYSAQCSFIFSSLVVGYECFTMFAGDGALFPQLSVPSQNGSMFVVNTADLKTMESTRHRWPSDEWPTNSRPIHRYLRNQHTPVVCL